MPTPYAPYRCDTPGWATFGLALPESDDAFSVQVGSLPTQFDHKNIWDETDGVIRFGVVTVKFPAAGDYPIVINPTTSRFPVRRAVRQELPAVVVTYTVNGIPWTSTLPTQPTESTRWLSGPLVTEGRAIVVPTSSGTPHALLDTIFDVRVYNDGSYRVDICGTNGKDIAAADQIGYDLTITINGQTVYSKPAALHMYCKRWRKLFWGGPTAEAQITPDFESFYLAGRFERYLPGVVNPTYGISGPTWDILQNGSWFGDMAADMPQPGGRPELGPYPAWAVQYLVHRTHNLRQHLLACADLGGSWSGHLTEPEGGTQIVRLDKGVQPNRGQYWFDSRWNDGGGNADGPKNGGRGTGARTQAPHLYSIYQIPYSITGDRYYLDGLKFWAAQQILQTYTGACMSPMPGTNIDFGRQGAKGLFMPYANEPRGFAWGLREVADAAEACPDDDPDKPYFTTITLNNCQATDDYARNHPGGFYPATFDEDTVPSLGGNYGILGTWQLDYLVWSMDNCRRKGFGPTKAFRDRINTCNVTLMLPPMDPVVAMALYYPYCGVIVAGKESDPTPPRRRFAFFDTRENSETRGQWVIGETSPTPHSTYQRFPDIQTFMAHLAPSSGYVIGYYGGDMRLSLMQAVRDGIPRAAEAMSYLLAYRDASGTSIIEDVCSQARSQYAITLVGSAPPIPIPPPVDSIVVTASILTANEDDPNHGNNTASVTLTPTAIEPPPIETKTAEQEITLVVDDPDAPVGATVHLTGTWTNHGPDPGTGNTAKIVWPARLTYLSHTASQGSYDQAAKVWTLGTVAAGASATLVISARVEAPARR